MSEAYKLPGNLLVLAAALILILLIPSGAMAYETVDYPQVTYFHAVAPEDTSIVDVRGYNVHNAGDHTFWLNSYGQVYQLDINVESTQNVLWEADITLTYPNSTIETVTVSQAQVAWDYNILIQVTDEDLIHVVDADLVIGLNPLTAGWNMEAAGLEDNYIPFSEVVGTSTEPMDVSVYLFTPEEFQDVQEGNIFTSFGSFLEWSWDLILDFIEAIPGVGPYAVALLEITVMTLEEIFWWINFLLIENIEISILLVEFFIIGHALMSTSSLIGLLKRILDDHIAVFHFTVRCIFYMKDLVVWVIKMATDIITAIKPI